MTGDLVEFEISVSIRNLLAIVDLEDLISSSILSKVKKNKMPLGSLVSFLRFNTTDTSSVDDVVTSGRSSSSSSPPSQIRRNGVITKNGVNKELQIHTKATYIHTTQQKIVYFYRKQLLVGYYETLKRRRGNIVEQKFRPANIDWWFNIELATKNRLLRFMDYAGITRLHDETNTKKWLTV